MDWIYKPIFATVFIALIYWAYREAVNSDKLDAVRMVQENKRYTDHFNDLETLCLSVESDYGSCHEEDILGVCIKQQELLDGLAKRIYDLELLYNDTSDRLKALEGDK